MPPDKRVMIVTCRGGGGGGGKRTCPPHISVPTERQAQGSSLAGASTQWQHGIVLSTHTPNSTYALPMCHRYPIPILDSHKATGTVPQDYSETKLTDEYGRILIMRHLILRTNKQCYMHVQFKVCIDLIYMT